MNAVFSIDQNLSMETVDGISYVKCSACNFVICKKEDNYKEHLQKHEGPPLEAGSHISPHPELFVEKQILFRQFYCPSCFVVLVTEVVPKDRDPFLEDKKPNILD